MMAFFRLSSIVIFFSVLLAPQLIKAQGDDNLIYNSKPVNPQGHLLWFNGHYSPANKKLFIIDKDSLGKGGGGTITKKPGGDIQVTTSGGDEWNKKVDQALKSIENWEKKLDDPGSNTDLTTFHMNTLLKKDAEASKEEWQGYKIDTKQDILGQGSQVTSNASSDQGNQGSQGSQSGQSNLVSNVGDYCQSKKSQYDEIISFYEAHKSEKYKDLQYNAPPTLEYNCYSCDSNKQKEHDTIVEHYVKDFFQPEYRLLKNACTLLHELNGMGLQSDFGDPGVKPLVPELEDLFHVDKKDPSKSGACSFLDFYKLYDAVQFLAMRGYWKAQKMEHDHRKDWMAARAIIRTVCEGARNAILITGNDQLENGLFEDLIPLVNQAFEYYYGLLSKNDWTQIPNLAFIISLARDQGLLGSTNSDSYLDRIIQIVNSFELTIDMDVKIGKDQGYHLAHLKGKCHVIPDFVEDSNQCYKWVVADDQNKGREGLFYRAKMQQSIDVDELANEFVTQSGPRPVYVGTKKYITLLSELHMDFCHPGKDTIVLSSFVPNPQENGTWLFPGGIKTSAAIMGAEQNFKNINQMKELVNSGKAQQASNQMEEQAKKLKAQMESVASQLKSGKASLQDYQKILELSQKAKDVSNNENIAPIIYIDFELPVQNHNPVIIDKRFDAKQINPQLENVIIYGYYTIHLENKANPKPLPPSAPPKK